MFRKLATLLIALPLLGCSPLPEAQKVKPSTTEVLGPTLKFTVCGKDLPGLECAVAVVDKDRRTPSIDKLDVRVGLLRSFSPTPAGAVFVNPGGPGSSAVRFLSLASGSFAQLRETHDVYAIDPRGTQGAAPINCPYDLSDVYGLDVTPDSAEEERLMLYREQEYVNACALNGSEVIGFLSTKDTASDMSDILDMLGFGQMDYIGFSYGSELGAVFATMFPDKVGRFVFDGAADFRKTPVESSLEQGRGFESSLREFLARCDVEECFDFPAREALSRALASVEAGKVSYQGSVVNSGVLYIGLASLLYTPGSDARIARGLSEFLDGNGETFSLAFESYLARDKTGADDGSLDAFRAITTEDGYRMSIEEQAELLERASHELPFFWPVFSQPVQRLDPWPETGEREDRAVTLPEGRVLYVAATGDPATTYKDTVSLAGDLGAPVLTREGTGHTSYFFSSCIRSQVHSFLQKRNVLLNTCETDR